GLIKSQFEQLNSIIILSFFSILIFVGFIISCALINPNYISYGYMSYDYNVYNGLIISTSALIAGFGIFNVPVSILILGNDWKNEWANKNKLLWGILSLLLLGFIGSLIFGFISRKKYENEYPKIYDSVNSNNTLNLYKHYKTDLKLSRLLIILCSISLIFFLAFAPTISVVITQEQDGSPGYNMCLVVAIISGTFWQAFNIVLSIIILSFKWENNWARKHQLLFGLLSIFVIFFISIFIFSTKVLKQSKKSLANEEFDNFKKKTRFNQIFETKESDNSNNN
ncbi:MAG: hypothetical protein K2I49_02135, partial [Ureaplasma sp.]|nr:hypothetical protein [Ureaplasma sp.]